MTHAHPEGINGAIAVAVAAAWACEPQGALFDAVLAAVPEGEVRRRCAEAAKYPPTSAVWQVATRVGAGENVLAEDTVPFSLWCAARFIDSYEEALWTTVSALGDRDATCTIVGGIVALRGWARDGRDCDGYLRGMSTVITWNGREVPKELKSLPTGRYVVESLDSSLTAEEEHGISAAIDSVKAGKTVSLAQARRTVAAALKRKSKR